MKFWVDLKYLWLEQMMEIRVSWYWYLLFSLVIPLAMVVGFARFGRGLTDQTSLIYIISGSAIFAVVNNGLYAMAMRLGAMKKEGMLVYCASLPISKVAFVAAIMRSRLLILLPSMLFPILAGSLIYNVHLELSPWILILLPLTALSMSIVGMAIGLMVDNLELTNWIVTAVLFLVVMVAPVFIPTTALPTPLQIFSYAFPPSYAADALQRVFLGDMGTTFYLDMAVLTLMVAFSFYIFRRWSFWRLRQVERPTARMTVVRADSSTSSTFRMVLIRHRPTLRADMTERTMGLSPLPEQTEIASTFMNTSLDNQPIYSALIVDDNWFNRDICRMALNSVGYRLTEADNGAVALDFLAQNTFDLMVLDLDMPVVGGLAVLRQVRADLKHSKMRVIVLTAHSHMATEELDTAADFVMHKPINIVEFAAFAGRLKAPSFTARTPYGES